MDEKKLYDIGLRHSELIEMFRLVLAGTMTFFIGVLGFYFNNLSYIPIEVVLIFIMVISSELSTFSLAFKNLRCDIYLNGGRFDAN